MMKDEIASYHRQQADDYALLCDSLYALIEKGLPDAESRLWHSHPVWFIDDNPIVGYRVIKKGVRLMFWSGADFDEETLNIIGKTFKDASVLYSDVSQIVVHDINRWLQKSRTIQWDYKNIVKKKGHLEKITDR